MIRVIPTVLVDNTTVVKGNSFHNWRTVGSVYSTARLLAARDVDEIVFLDTKASFDNRIANLDFIRDFAAAINVPFGVGGGIKTTETAKKYIRNGCEKIILGDIVFDNPEIIGEIAESLGSQAVIVSVDLDDDWRILRRSGQSVTNEKLLDFILKLEDLGAGELLIQSVTRDGSMSGYDLALLKACTEVAQVPIMASGGAGKIKDFLDAAELGVSAVCAGAFFQFTEFTPDDVKTTLKASGFRTRV